MRSAMLFVLLGAAIAVNGCGSSSTGTGTGGSGGGAAGKGGAAGTSAGGTGGSTAGSGGSAGKGGAGGSAGGGAAGGSAGTTGTGGTGGAQACGADPGPGNGATCNTITTGGPCVTELVATGPIPTAAGGTIVAGTYNLTSISLYNAPDGSAEEIGMGRRTLVVSGVVGTSFTLDQVETSGARTDRSHGTVAIAGTTATFTPTCPPPSDGGNNNGTVGFTITPTATSTTLTIIDNSNGNGSVEVDVYTKA